MTRPPAPAGRLPASEACNLLPRDVYSAVDQPCSKEDDVPEPSARAQEAREQFQNSQTRLDQAIPKVRAARSEAGLDGLVGDLQCVILNTEPDRFQAAVGEWLRFSGMELAEAFENDQARTAVLRTGRSADILLTCRTAGPDPFQGLGDFPKSRHLPHTRLETYVFETPAAALYAEIQRRRGLTFLQDAPIQTAHLRWIQTAPSRHTANAIGVIQWTGESRSYASDADRPLRLDLEKPDAGYQRNIRHIDHVATRLHAADRDAAILEFMALTNYDFQKAFYVETMNSITNVARLAGATFAMVFTTGIHPYVSDAVSGPTEKFVHNYGPRTHHLALHTENIEDTFDALLADGMEFLVELVGSPAEGLRQTFTEPSPHTLLVNEYIHRYGDFDGFFTKSNVTALTEATDKQ